MQQYDSNSSLSEEEVPDSSREQQNELNQNSWEDDSSSSSDDEDDKNNVDMNNKNNFNAVSQLNQRLHISTGNEYDSSSSDSSSDGSGSSNSSNEVSGSDVDINIETNKRKSSKESCKDVPWEENPDIYGIRRSSRARREPQRLVIQSGSEDSDGSQQRAKKRRSRKKSDSWIPTLSGSESEESDSSYDVPQKRQPRRRVNKYGAPKRKQQRGRALSASSDDYKTSKKNKKRFSTALTRNAGNKVSYKEETDDETDSDDIIEQDEDTRTPADDVETIEKVMQHRRGIPGITGAQTTVYAEEVEKISKLGEPDPEKDVTELQFLIKWKTWSHLHNTWETKETLTAHKAAGMKKLENYIKRMEQIDEWKRNASPEDIEYYEMQTEMNEDLQKQYQKVERIIGHQFSAESSSSYPDYLCKWQGLPYSECTFEDGELTARFFQPLIDEYLERERSDTIPNKNAKCLRHRPKFVALKKQPDYLGNSELQLRDYQLDGLNWLVHAWCRELSVILADEMGLGKTIQTISFLSYLFHTHNLYGPFLVVVPLSTMDAWQREFQLWGTGMNVIVYIGDLNSRITIQEHEWCFAKSRKLKFNVLLTTYEMLLRDKELLGSLNWACLLIDEAHRLKNDDSLLYRILVDFKTNFRLLITGTPLQNSLKELWSLMHFIMPTKFDSWEEFESKYSIHDKEELQKLHHDLEPYLLRRVKKDVERSLPAKVEQILRMEMSTAQKEYYKLILTKNVKELCKELKGSFSGLLNIIVELKKCCNHSNLIKPLDATAEAPNLLETIIKGSGKMVLLDKLLSRLKETGHRVLIFSQMVRMLDIIADYLYLKRYAFQRLDGSIRGEQRTRALDHFNAEGSQDFCFLLSTRAGGLGINLASADTVIIFDSDWNPQNDLQAMARAHRIGQKKQVNIYRFVTKNTIEEDIIERAKKKMVLDHLIIQRMDTTGRRILSKADNRPSSITLFNKEELSSILKFGAEDLFKDVGDSDQKLHAMDIDDILLRAETQESHEGPSLGEDLLSQFKVVNYAAFDEEIDIKKSAHPVEKLWDEIIPEEDRKRVEEEMEKEKNAELHLKPRSRKTVEKMNIPLPTSKKVKSKAIVEIDFSNTSESEEIEEEDTGAAKEKKTTLKKIKAEICTVKGLKCFTNAEIRRFIKSYKKFARPMTRLDSIAEDAELTDKSTIELKELGELLKSSCEQAVKEYQEKLLQDEQFDGKKKGATLKIAGVTINAPSVLKVEADLEILAVSLPSDVKQQKTYRLTIPTRSVHWGIPWGVVEDSMLLVGVLIYGLGNWDAIKNDHSLLLSHKILPVGNAKPQDKHLQARAEYLLKILKEQQVNQSKTENEKKKTKREHVFKNDEYKSPKSETDYMKPSKSTEKKKLQRNVTKKTEKPAKKKEIITERVASPLDSEKSVYIKDIRENMDEVTFKKCKEKMRPERKSLQLLQKPDEKASSQEQVQTTKRCLLKIGDHIEKCLVDYSNVTVELNVWRSSLWSFVSKFTELDPEKLYKLYRTACRKRDCKSEEKKSKPEKIKAGHSTISREAGKHTQPDRMELEEARKKTLGIHEVSLIRKIPKLKESKTPQKSKNSNNNSSNKIPPNGDEKLCSHHYDNSSSRSANPVYKRSHMHQVGSTHKREASLHSTADNKSGTKIQTYKEWKEAQMKRKLEQDEKPAQKENRHSNSKKPYRHNFYADKQHYGDEKTIQSDEKPSYKYELYNSSIHDSRSNRPRYNRDREHIISPSYSKSPLATHSPSFSEKRKRTSSNNSDISTSSKRAHFDEDCNASKIFSENA